MLMCRNVVRMLGKPGRAGAKWEVRLANNGIPFVTDGMTRKWCMSYFQESEHVVAPAVAPLNLDLSSIIENEGEGEGATAHNMPPPGAPPVSKVQNVQAGSVCRF